MYFSWDFCPLCCKLEYVLQKTFLSCLKDAPKSLCLDSFSLCFACYFQLKLCWPCIHWSCERSSSNFSYMHLPPSNTLPAADSGHHQQKRGIKAFWILWLSRESFPCMKDSGGLDPDGIKKLLHFVRLSQTLCENVVCLLFCKLGLPGSCALSLRRWLCRTFFEFLT